MTLTSFTETAQKARIYEFFLRDGDRLQSYTVRRNGASVQLTGQLTLFVNPQDLSKEHPASVHVVKTPHGAWVDHFGLALPKWSLRGHTGWRARHWPEGSGPGPVMEMDGYLAFHALTDLFQAYMDVNLQRSVTASRTGQPQPLLKLYFRDHYDDEYWEIEPEALPVKRRSADRPLLVSYELRFTGVKNLREKGPADDDAIGQGLRGGQERDVRTLAAFNRSLVDAEAAIQSASESAQSDPVGESEASKFIYAALEEEQVAEQPIATAYYARVDEARDTGTPLPDPAEAIQAIKSQGNVPEQLSLSERMGNRLSSLLQQGKDIQVGMDLFVRGATSYITTPLKTVNSFANQLRGVMLGIGWALSLGSLTTRLRESLRLLRTTFRNLLCAVQSILAFPYNFVKGLRDSLQDFLNLIALSGCASTFPRITAPSWAPSLPLTVPRPF